MHELKTPITPVLAAAELLLEEVKEEPILGLTRSIYRGASNLNRRIDELLDLARSEIGTLQLNPLSLDPLLLLQEIADGVKPVALENEQHFNVELPYSIPAVWADRDRFTQIIQNLLNNAFKFTPAGETITIRAKDDGANLTVEVQDTGRGITKEDQERLFDPYHRLPGDRERFSGLGLGLALSKRLANLHGGDVWVESSIGKGSTFSFSMPLESAGRKDERV